VFGNSTEFLSNYIRLLNFFQLILSPSSIVLIIPVIVVTGEVDAIINSPVLRSFSTWVELTLAGVVGLLINIATYLQISLTSALTHNISGTAKACAQTALGILIYQNAVSAAGIFGILLTIGGSAAYAYVRKLEHDQKEQQANLSQV
jgi:GDP-fucose transporter C1